MRLQCFSGPGDFPELRGRTLLPQPIDALRANDLQLLAGWRKVVSWESAQRGYKVVAYQVQPGISTTADCSKHQDAIGTIHRQSTGDR